MNGIHCITGVPRSGSTLLCNILNQNPKFYASDTSVIPELLGILINKISTSPEIQGLLNGDTDYTQDRLRYMLQSMIEAWYIDYDETVFDKSRGWAYHALLMADLFPDAKFIVTTRDLRNVFASIEKQHRNTSLFDTATTAQGKTMFARADTMLAADGLIGVATTGLEDLMDRCPDNVFVVKYERLSKDPRTTLADLYEFLGMRKYKHSFKDIENVSEEPDHMYLNKFPHEGSGTVKPEKGTPWKEYVGDDLAELIFGRYPKYNSLFGYQQ